MRTCLVILEGGQSSRVVCRQMSSEHPYQLAYRLCLRQLLCFGTKHWEREALLNVQDSCCLCLGLPSFNGPHLLPSLGEQNIQWELILLESQRHLHAWCRHPKQVDNKAQKPHSISASSTNSGRRLDLTRHKHYSYPCKRQMLRSPLLLHQSTCQLRHCCCCCCTCCWPNANAAATAAVTAAATVTAARLHPWGVCHSTSADMVSCDRQETGAGKRARGVGRPAGGATDASHRDRAIAAGVTGSQGLTLLWL